MDNLLLRGQKNVPITTDTLAFMQSAAALLEKLVVFGGDDYILAGCVVSGTTITEGYMVLAGQLVYCAGGTVSDTLYVKEMVTTVPVGSGERNEVIYKVIFGTPTNGETAYSWETINSCRITNIITLASLISDLTKDVDGKEDSFTKNSGFNLDKSDAVNSSDSDQLATSAAAKTAYDKAVTALTQANVAINNAVTNQHATIVHNFTCYGYTSSSPYQLPNTANYFIQKYRAIGQGDYYVRLPEIGGIIRNNSIIHIVYPSKTSWGSEYFRIYPNTDQSLDYDEYWNIDHKHHLICQLKDSVWYAIGYFGTNI